MKRTVVIAVVVVLVSIPLVAPASPVGAVARIIKAAAPRAIKLTKDAPKLRYRYEVLTGELNLSRPASRPLLKTKRGEINWGDEININIHKVIGSTAKVIGPPATIGTCGVMECYKWSSEEYKPPLSRGELKKKSRDSGTS